MAVITAFSGLANIIKKAMGIVGAKPESTPSISNQGRGRRSHAHVPNDGRWHMKHHRS